MEAATLAKISEDLDFLKKEVIEIRTHMVDVDSLLTPEEKAELDASIDNYKKGKTTNLDDVKKELGL
jgi:hypothetical protein